MLAGSLEIQMAVEMAKLSTDLKRVEGMVGGSMGKVEQAAGAAMRALGALGAGLSFGALAHMVKSINDGVDALNDLRDATGASIENISALESAAKRTGANFGTVEASLIKFNQALGTTIKPGGDAEKVIAAIGLNAKALRDLDPAEALRQTAVALNQFADDGNKARAIQELFGKSLKEVAPFLKDLAEQGQLNATVTTEQAEAAEKFNKELFKMEAAMEDVGRAIVGPMVTGMNSLVDYFKQAQKEGDGLIATLLKLPAAAQNSAINYLFGTNLQGHKSNGYTDTRKLLGGVNSALTGNTLSAAERQMALQEQARLQAQMAGYLNSTAGSGRGMGGYEGVAKGSLVLPPEIDKKAIAAANKELDEQAKLLAEINGLSGSFAEEWSRRSVLFAKGQITLEQLTKSQADLLSQQPGIKPEQAKAQEEQTARVAAARKAYLESHDAVVAADKAMKDYRQGIADANAVATFELSIMGQSEAVRERMLAQLRARLALEGKLREIALLPIPREEKDRLGGEAKAASSDALTGVMAGIDLKDLKALDDYLDPAKAKSFGDALKDAFGEAGNALAQLGNALQDYTKKQAEHDKQVEAFAAARKSLSAVDQVKKETELSQKQAEIQIGAYADMAGAAKGFFKEGSKGYKGLEAAERAFRLYELTMAAEAMAKKIFFKTGEVTATTALNATKLAGEASTSAASSGLAATEASAWGITAVVKALASLPFPFNLAAGAATLAAVVAVGAKMMGGVGGASVDVAKQRQEAQGTGTVLGDSAAKTESIANAMEYLKDSAKIELGYQSGMLAALRNIESSLGGLASLVVRSTGLTGDYEGPTTLGTFKNKNPGGSWAPDPIGVILGLWGKTSKTLNDQGIQFASQQLADIIAEGGGVVANAFAEITTTKSSWFGLKKSTSTSTELSDLDGEILDQFTAVVNNIVDATRLATTALGQSAADYDANIAAVIVDLGKVSFKDLTGAEIEEQLTSVFGALGDDIARAAMPDIDAFQLVGEGLFETLIRVAGGVETAAYELDQFGLTAIAYTDVLNKQGDVGAEIVRQTIMNAESAGDALSGVGDIMRTLDGTASDLADAYSTLLDVQKSLVAVGLDPDALTRSMVRGSRDVGSLQDGLDSYLENFFSPAEKAAAATNRMRGEFEQLGLVMPASIEGFRGLVSGIDITTEAGQLLLGQVLGLADGFYDMTQTAEEFVSTLSDGLMASYEDLSSILDGVIDKNRAYIDALQDLQDNLTRGPLALLSPEAAYQKAQAEFLRLNALPAGNEERLAGLPSAGEAFLQASQQYNASSVQYFKDLDAVMQAAEDSKVVAQDTLTAAEQELATIKSQLTMLGLIKTEITTQTAAEAAFYASLQAYMTGTGTAATGSTGGTAAGGYSGTGGYSGPVGPDGSGGFTTQAGQSVSAAQMDAIQETSSATMTLSQVYRDMYGHGIAGGLYGTIPDTVSGWSVADMQAWAMAHPSDSTTSWSAQVAAAQAQGIDLATLGLPDGSHRDGLYSVPFDGYRAELHKSERVLTAGQAHDADMTAGYMSELVAENKALRADVGRLIKVTTSYASRDLENGDRLARSSDKTATTAKVLYSRVPRNANEVATV